MDWEVEIPVEVHSGEQENYIRMHYLKYLEQVLVLVGFLYALARHPEVLIKYSLGNFLSQATSARIPR